jgi:integrase
MGSVVILKSGRFRAFAQVKKDREDQTFDRRNEAELWAEKTEGRMRAGTWVKPLKQAELKVQARAAEEVEQRTLLKVQQAYIESEEWLAKADTTRRAELSKQKAVLAALGSKVLTEFTVDDVRAYMAKRRREPSTKAAEPGTTVKAHTLRLEVAALSAMLNFAVVQKWISVNPVRGVKRPRGDRRTARVDDELMGEIFDHPAVMMDSKAYMFFRILFSSICRPGELASAQRTWLRHDFPQIHLPRSKNEDERVIVLARGTYKQLLSWLEEQPADCPYIFGTKKLSGEGWSPYNYATVWRKLRKDLGLAQKKVVAYSSRHEGISRLFEQTKLSDGQIAGLSGHRSPQALWHYKHLRNEHQRPTIEAYDKVVSDAIDRAISPAHPSRAKGPGEFFDEPKPKAKRPRIKPALGR